MTQSIRILIVDPSETSCQQTANQFTGREDVEVVRATDGPAAIAALNDDAIDIAIIDQRTPKLDGKAVQAWTLEQGRRSLLVLTADRLSDRWQAISAHINAYDTLLKPVRRPRADSLLASYRRLQIPGRALIVDSTIATSRMTASLLRQSRFEFSVEQIDSGLHAIRIAELDRFDIALISLQLEDLPGLEVATRLGEQANAPRIILIGGPADRATMGESTLEAFGAKAYLRKPFTAHGLEAALHSALGLWKPYLAKALSETVAKAEPDEGAQRAAAR